MTIFNGQVGNDLFSGTAGDDVFNYGNVTLSGSTVTAGRGLDTITSGGGTDRLTFAWVCDVIVDEPYRGRGVGHWLMRTVTDAVEATGVRRQILATADAHEVYRAMGYTGLAHPERWMEKDDRPPMGQPPAH